MIAYSVSSDGPAAPPAPGDSAPPQCEPTAAARPAGESSASSCRTARSEPKRSWLSRQFHAACETSRQAEHTTRSEPATHISR